MLTATHTDTDVKHLAHAARIALRGFGSVEPNPMVGCVIVQGERVVGWGHHRRPGGPHAEVAALRRAGDRARGASMYVTLEPCTHHGRTAPCTDAVIEAGIARVVIAQSDPHDNARGGARILRDAGIEVSLDERCHAANLTSAPFRHRVQTGRPWLIAKWAQTIDGRIATRLGESQWISSESSRRLVHRLRGRVGAILSGIGTVLRDDPLLTARKVRLRRIARRVIIDPNLLTPVDARLLHAASGSPVSIACDRSRLDSPAADALRGEGVEILPITSDHGDLPLRPVLEHLAAAHDITTVLTECGAGLLGRLFRQGLVNQSLVFTAPMLFGDEQAPAALRGTKTPHLSDVVPMRLIDLRRRGDDVVASYEVAAQGMERSMNTEEPG